MNPEKGNQVEPPAPALPERWVATSSPANPCTICGRPFESADPFVGDGDGSGQRFAHLGCYRGREYQQQNDKAYDRKARLAENAEDLFRFAKQSLPAVEANADMIARQAQVIGGGMAAGIAEQARQRAEWLKALVNRIDGTPEEGNKP